MRRQTRPIKRRQLLLLILLVAVGFVVYIRSRPQQEVSSPLTIQPTTPADRDMARKKSLTSLSVALTASYKLHGKYPLNLPKTETAICNGSSVHCKQVKLVDLNLLLSDGLIPSIPSDPIGGSGQYNSGFSIRGESDGSILLLAPRTEGPTTISVKL